MVAVSKVLYDSTSALNEVSDTFSLACSRKLSFHGRACEMNDLWNPSSNKMLLLMLVPS